MAVRVFTIVEKTWTLKIGVGIHGDDNMLAQFVVNACLIQ